MSREIKFRYIFENDDGEICSVDIITLRQLELGEYNWIHRPSQTLKVKARDLFTGLKDKNGVEIYEGDITRVKKNHYGKPMGNQYRTVKWMVVRNYCGWNIGLSDKREVIGNIYQHKHLLESKDE